MPLPDNGVLWPPPVFASALDDVRLHAAWYAGDRASLAASYGRREQVDTTRRPFWSRRGAPPLGQRDQRLHIPLAADIATTSADLLFSEPPTFEVEDGATQDRLDVLIDDGGIINRLLEGAEVAAALGGVYLKADWDRDLADRPLLAVVHEDAAVPEFRWGQLVAVTFWREVARNGAQVVRHLERHELVGGQAVILHGLYDGSETNLGRPVPLTESPHTEGLVDGLTDGNSMATGIVQLTAAYVPNMRPNRVRRGSDLGRSDYQGVTDLFDALDETWTSWMRDLRLGRGRLVVPEGFLQVQGRGQGAEFDPEREVYQSLSMPPSSKDSITLSQFEIRVDEHARTAQEIVARAVAVAGYSGQTFGLAGDVAATATEVTARERKSFITRDKKTRYWRPGLSHMTEVLLKLDVALGFAPRGVVPSRPTITFGDTVSEDPVQTATTLDLLSRAGAMSTQVKVERLHPDWDEREVAEEVGRIQRELGQPVPDPTGVVPASALPPVA